jgi:hypothetical protein
VSDAARELNGEKRVIVNRYGYFIRYYPMNRVLNWVLEISHSKSPLQQMAGIVPSVHPVPLVAYVPDFRRTASDFSDKY